MKIVSCIEVSQIEWNNICDLSDDAWLFHRYEWIKIEETFFIQSNYSFAILSDCGELIGIQPLYFHDLGFERLLDSGIHRHTGLALSNHLSLSQIKAARKLSMSHVKKLASQIDADRIQLNSHNLAPKNLSLQREEIPFWMDEDDFYLGLHFTETGFVPVPGMRSCCADQIVHLKNASTEDLFRGLHDSCQRAVKKANKNGLAIEFAQGNSDIDFYYKIAQLSAQRTGEILPSIDYFNAIFDVFYGKGQCVLLFALYQGQRIGALFLLIDKGSVSFMTGVSDPSFLSLRVNDFMHWEAIKWANSEGYQTYRLGPYFPEIPKDSPVEKVSRFKKKFGGRNTTIIEGSYFCKPEKYKQNGMKEIESLCKPKDIMITELNKTEKILATHSEKTIFLGNQNETSIKIILRAYGLMTLPFQISSNNLLLNSQMAVIFVSEKTDLTAFGVKILFNLEKELLYSSQTKKTWNPFKSIKPIYHALLPHITFLGENIEPVWANEKGQAAIAWLKHKNKKILLIGLNVEEEIIRHRQGDPSKVLETATKGDFGFAHERANYLFEDQIHPKYPTYAWADYLGFFLAETFSKLSGFPLINILPNGAKGAVILTGDDDQAFLEKYDQQLKIIGNCPITYLLVPQTKHTKETLSKMPINVEIGLHPDALEQPDQYEHLCTEQANFIRQLSGKPIRTLRNHGYLDKGYLGHLNAWEENDIGLSVNYSKADGTVMNASLLPMKMRTPDGKWSNHYSLLTAFGDGMIFALNWTENQSIKKVRQLVDQIESSYPSVLVFNLHPQNIDNTLEFHYEVLRIAHRSNWIALGLESYFEWLETLEQIQLKWEKNILHIQSNKVVHNLNIRYFNNNCWRRITVNVKPPEIQLSIES